MSFGPWQFGTTEVIALLQTGTVLLVAWWAKETAELWIKKRATLRKAEVAEKCLELIYEADDVFKNIRYVGAPISVENLSLTGNKKMKPNINAV